MGAPRTASSPGSRWLQASRWELTVGALSFSVFSDGFSHDRRVVIGKLAARYWRGHNDHWYFCFQIEISENQNNVKSTCTDLVIFENSQGLYTSKTSFLSVFHKNENDNLWTFQTSLELTDNLSNIRMGTYSASTSLQKRLWLAGQFYNPNTLNTESKLVWFLNPETGSELQVENTFNVTPETFKKAISKKTGARGLRSILENILLKTMFELPDMEDVIKVTVDKSSVRGLSEPIVTYGKKQSTSVA